MENYITRTPFVVSHSLKGVTSEEEYEKYRIQTRGEYEELMMDFEFRCRRAAMMNYYEATSYDKIVYRMEIIAALLGTVSLTSLGAWLLQEYSQFSFSNLSKYGGTSLASLAGAFIIELLSKGSTSVIPSFSRRANVHVTVAAAWQKLAQKTRSYRIQLDNPKLDVPVYAEWYSELIAEREKLCSVTTIPESTYQLFSNPSNVFEPLKKRRQMFLQYLELENQDQGDSSDQKKV